MLPAASEDAGGLYDKIGYFLLLLVEKAGAVGGVLLLLLLLVSLFVLSRPVVSRLFGLLQVLFNPAEVEVCETRSAQVFGKKFEEVVSKVFDNKFLFYELGAEALSPPVADLLHFGAHFERFAFVEETHAVGLVAGEEGDSSVLEGSPLGPTFAIVGLFGRVRLLGVGFVAFVVGLFVVVDLSGSLHLECLPINYI
jgi:hypothetical protein